MERLKALPFHSTPQAISCSSRFHGNPAFLFAIWPSSMRFASQNSGCMRTSRTIIVHTLLKIDGVENPDAVSLFQKSVAALNNDGTLRVCYDVGAVALQKIWLYPKSSLAGAGTAYDQHIFVSGILGVGRTVGHHQALRLRQNDVVLKFGSDKRGNILCVSP